jgi:hypothetical protein
MHYVKISSLRGVAALVVFYFNPVTVWKTSRWRLDTGDRRLYTRPLILTGMDDHDDDLPEEEPEELEEEKLEEDPELPEETLPEETEPDTMAAVDDAKVCFISPIGRRRP